MSPFFCRILVISRYIMEKYTQCLNYCRFLWIFFWEENVKNQSYTEQRCWSFGMWTPPLTCNTHCSLILSRKILRSRGFDITIIYRYHFSLILHFKLKINKWISNIYCWTSFPVESVKQASFLVKTLTLNPSYILTSFHGQYQGDQA